MTAPETREPIRRMAREYLLRGQCRIQAKLARLGINVCARTVAKYMRRAYDGTPSPSLRQFLAEQAVEACGLSNEYVAYYNRWRPHRSLDQRARCAASTEPPRRSGSKVTAKPILRGLHHVYQWAA